MKDKKLVLVLGKGRVTSKKNQTMIDNPLELGYDVKYKDFNEGACLAVEKFSLVVVDECITKNQMSEVGWVIDDWSKA